MLKLKKALSSAFFVAWVSANSVFAACVPNSGLEPVAITKVVDGDTVRLSSGRSVRLLGINTPELNPRTGNPEPYAKEAQQLLQALSRGAEAKVVLGTEAEDRYKRLLAHLVLDGRNAAQALLERGLGWAVVIEPNTSQADCLMAAESRARASQLGVWANPVRPAGELNRGGFAVVQGEVTRIDATQKYIYLEIDDHLALRLTRKHFSPKQVVSFGKALGRKVEARGWVIDRRAKLKAGSRYKGFLLPLGSQWHLSLIEARDK